MVEIIPSVLTGNLLEAKQMIKKCDGITRRVQVDIIDGVFANNKTIVPEDLRGLDVFLGLDFHLMVKDPAMWIDRCLGVGADRIIGQIELMPSQKDFVKRAQEKNLRLGLAIDLDTPLTKIEYGLLADLDVVLVMSVSAGFGGQKFNPRSLEKVSELNRFRIENKIPFRICVDGGETTDVIDDTVIMGADEIAVGRRLFEGDLESNVKNMTIASLIH